jgi:nifR3 family TIM-barrel protein
VSFDFDAFFRSRPAILAPMEDVSDAAFRQVCRARGASLAVTEFVHADALIEGTREAQRKITLAPGDAPTAIQIYGADPSTLVEAAAIAERAEPAFIDINCGCWVPKVARKGAGAAWLREPDAMVAMASVMVKQVALPVTVKTRLGWGDEAEMPIVDLARRLEDVGVRAITVHCRTALMGHEGEADWRWAKRVRDAVSIPVILNGDVRRDRDAGRAMKGTGCAAVMIGRRAIEHPWIFREVRARLDHDASTAPPTERERWALVREHLLALAAKRAGKGPLRTLRRYLPGYLSGVTDARTSIRRILESASVEHALEVLDEMEADLAA